MSASRDRWLSELYRASAREEPPAALDAEVLAESRKESQGSKRMSWNWGAPLAAAAVVMVTVSLVIAVRDGPVYPEALTTREDRPQTSATDAGATGRPETDPEQDRRLRHSASKRQALAEAKQADGTLKSARETHAASTTDTPPAAVPPSAAVSNAGSSERVATSPAAPPNPSSLPSLPAREERSVQSQVPTSATAGRTLGKFRASDEAEGAVEQKRANPPAARDQAASRPTNAGDNDPQRFEASVNDRSTPEAWLDTIVKLRNAGQHSEAKKSLEAFKKRYPEYPLPKALREF